MKPFATSRLPPEADDSSFSLLEEMFQFRVTCRKTIFMCLVPSDTGRHGGIASDTLLIFLAFVICTYLSLSLSRSFETMSHVAPGYSETHPVTQAGLLQNQRHVLACPAARRYTHTVFFFHTYCFASMYVCAPCSRLVHVEAKTIRSPGTGVSIFSYCEHAEN